MPTIQVLPPHLGCPSHHIEHSGTSHYYSDRLSTKLLHFSGLHQQGSRTGSLVLWTLWINLRRCIWCPQKEDLRKKISHINSSEKKIKTQSALKPQPTFVTRQSRPGATQSCSVCVLIRTENTQGFKLAGRCIRFFNFYYARDSLWNARYVILVMRYFEGL